MIGLALGGGLAILAVPAVRAQGAAPPPPAAGVDPLADMPDIGVDWPDLDQAPAPVAPTEPADMPDMSDSTAAATGAVAAPPAPPANPAASDLSATMDPATESRYTVELSGVDAIADDLFRTRFDALSALEQGHRKRANVAQIVRRAKTDLELVDKLLRTRGYYDGDVEYAVQRPGGEDAPLRVVLSVTSGMQYKLAQVDLTGLSPAEPREAKIRDLFAVKVGDPVDTDRILAGQAAVREGLAQGGYPFARVDDPVVRIDHEQRDGSLAMAVATGGYRVFGAIVGTGRKPFGADHVQTIARFRPGDPYNAADIADLNRALIATGLVSTVSIKPRQAADPARVDIAVAMTPAPPRTIAGELGYGTGEGLRAEASWQHRNLFPPEGSLTVRGVAGTQEQSLGVTFRRNNFQRRDRALNGQFSISNIDQPAFKARTLDLNGSIERQTNLIFQKKWTWSVGAQLLLSDERDIAGPRQVSARRTFLIAALPLSLAYDGSDDLLDPTRGFRLAGRLSPELSLQSGAFGYAKAQVDGSGYLPMGEAWTLAGRVRLGTIVGAGRDRIAPSRRFYAGGGGSVRGYSYQAIGPRDINNDPLGGRSLAELSLEARFRFGAQRQFGIVPFVDAGNISTNVLPNYRNFRVGAGLGARYYSSFGPIRIDVGTPVNPQKGDPRIAVYVSLGQAF
jgi:translocation and assembly module TamA